MTNKLGRLTVKDFEEWVLTMSFGLAIIFLFVAWNLLAFVSVLLHPNF